MPFDEGLAQRIRTYLGRRRDVDEKKMFGGLAFMVRGHMAFGIVGDELMVRVGPDQYAAALREPHAREMTFTGKPMRGMVYVGTAGFEEDEGLASWIERGLAFTRALEKKPEREAIGKKPPSKKPSSKEPSSKEPSSKEPSSKKPSSKKPSSKKSSSKKPVARKPAR